jgi:hypothetical protein
MKYTNMRKTIYSLPQLRELLLAAKCRYLEFLSALQDDTAGTDKLNKISRAVEENSAPTVASSSSTMKTRNCSSRCSAGSSTLVASKAETYDLD